MITSMTGFGRKEIERDGIRLTVEIRAVNHRFCEIHVRLPKNWMMFEDRMKKQVSACVQRGRVDVSINVEQLVEKGASLTVDWQTAEFYVMASRQLNERFSLPEPLHVKDLLHMPGVITEATSPVLTEEQIEGILTTCTSYALEDLLLMKNREGIALQADLESRLQLIKECSGKMQVYTPEVKDLYRKRIISKIEEFMHEQSYDEARLLQEVAMMAERADISEEIIRLQSHCDQLAEQLQQEGAVGKKLDFLLQEMNREANTVASKANHLEIQRLAVEVKTELEKMREQVQNVE
ncbi:YicC/YloC family endoribonuclease [Brevibacillus daliensis]|uniref:YicC/YloC family endoribonuclease n=1 Tax=Brevibacillus daliensis TaxID=2892995 RepID=UPI001E4A729B|nr:YicC/YloC family endoribonuclease [Brevibacillus daliensis]